MKHKIFAFLALLLTLTAACAGAQQRPSVGCFSPGLVRVSEKMKENPTVSADVTLTVENAFYARNLSVLKKRCTPGICPCFRRCWMERTSAFRRTGKPARFPLRAVAKR